MAQLACSDPPISSLYHDGIVPIPTFPFIPIFPVLPILILSTLLVFTTRSCASVVPINCVPGVVPPFP